MFPSAYVGSGLAVPVGGETDLTSTGVTPRFRLGSEVDGMVQNEMKGRTGRHEDGGLPRHG